jgi:hypothetical protein
MQPNEEPMVGLPILMDQCGSSAFHEIAQAGFQDRIPVITHGKCNALRLFIH